MSEFLQEPELTMVINDMHNRDIDPVALLEVTEEGVRWRDYSAVEAIKTYLIRGQDDRD